MDVPEPLLGHAITHKTDSAGDGFEHNPLPPGVPDRVSSGFLFG